jgi:hypothetical protein
LSTGALLSSFVHSKTIKFMGRKNSLIFAFLAVVSTKIIIVLAALLP